MSSPDPESPIDAFIAKYSPDIAAQLAEARARLRRRFPRGFEGVFDNYNALVFAFGPTGRASDAFISVAGYPKWVTLFFLHGTTLHDPTGLLQGSGKQVRNIRLKSAADLDAPDVAALIAQAIEAQRERLDAAPWLTTAIKTEVTTARPRRPAAESPKTRETLE